MDELKKLLENVSDTYDDFVGCVLCAVKHDDEDIRKVKDVGKLYVRHIKHKRD